ncbi:hypothetical protein PVAP13_5NG362281 [Panicum virgatum]|uniref:Uncharacterized protein n=1 Tax=Panicum virgatum TaxID=38727 RepID=A0A8T0RVG1_PANVG|nr:hypothetical protein PVAP13_5NG362281 [Panicum virgatum]
MGRGCDSARSCGGATVMWSLGYGRSCGGAGRRGAANAQSSDGRGQAVPVPRSSERHRGAGHGAWRGAAACDGGGGELRHADAVPSSGTERGTGPRHGTARRWLPATMINDSSAAVERTVIHRCRCSGGPGNSCAEHLQGRKAGEQEVDGRKSSRWIPSALYPFSRMLPSILSSGLVPPPRKNQYP